MATVNISVPDAIYNDLTAKHGDLADWLRGLALAEIRAADRRLAQKALKSGIMSDHTFTDALAALIRSKPAWMEKVDGSSN
jgi:hypothetical protein